MNEEGCLSLIGFIVSICLLAGLLFLAAIGFLALDKPPAKSYCQGYCTALELDYRSWNSSDDGFACTCLPKRIEQVYVPK